MIMDFTKQITLARFEKLIIRAWEKYDAFENKVEYRDNHSHEIVKGMEEYQRYLIAKDEVMKYAGQFPYMKRKIENLPV